MTPDYLLAVLAASLLGSLHCAAMCGGLVGAVSLSTGERGRRSEAFGFHIGRVLSYGVLGALAGWLGHAVDVVGRHAGVVGGVAMFAGAIVAAAGLASLLSTTTPMQLPRLRLLIAAQGWLAARVVATRLGSGGSRRGFWLGLSTALLPCGWLYAFVLTAAGTASVFYGALLMFAFWLGTVPALLTLGAVLRRLSAPLKRRVPILSAALLVIVGLSAILFRINIPAEVLASTKGAALHSAAVGGASPPCH